MAVCFHVDLVFVAGCVVPINLKPLIHGRAPSICSFGLGLGALVKDVPRIDPSVGGQAVTGVVLGVAAIDRAGSVLRADWGAGGGVD